MTGFLQKFDVDETKKGVLTLRTTGFISRVQVGTPLSGVTGSTRRWVVPVSDHRWSRRVIRNERARIRLVPCS